MGINDAITHRRRSRREVLRTGLTLAGAGALGLRLGRVARAQDSTPPAGDFSGLGLPEIHITASDSGYEGIPASIAAGRYLVTLTNTVTTQTTDSTVAAFVLLPDGVTTADLRASQGTPTAGSAPAATPDGGEDSTPAWFYTTTLAGGPSATPGQTVRGVVELTPGNWAIWGEDPAAPAKPVALTVTAPSNPAGATPSAEVTIDEVKTADGYMFQVNGALRHGTQVIQVVNQSDQPHFLLMIGSPVPLTMDQVQTLLSLPDGATPEPSSGLPDPASLQTGVYAGTQSPGTTQWIEADLDKNTYVLLCFISDPTKGGIPHASEGMAKVLTVGVEATPAP